MESGNWLTASPVNKKHSHTLFLYVALQGKIRPEYSLTGRVKKGDENIFDGNFDGK